MTSIPESSPIRAARAQDRAAIIDVVRASGLFPPDALTEVEATLDGFLTGAAATDRWLITDTGTRLAATAYYAPERMTDGTWNLYLLAVHPDHQGQGRGAALVRHVERDLREAGARILLIETSGVPGFAGQRAFYTGLGYTKRPVSETSTNPATTKSSTGKSSSLRHDLGQVRRDRLAPAGHALQNDAPPK